MEENFKINRVQRISGQYLDDLLEEIRPLRQEFLLELRGSIDELHDFQVNNPYAFCGYNKYCYFLGKHETLDLPYKDTLMPIDILYLSELYVKPEYRGGRKGSRLLFDIIYYLNTKQIPIVLGCNKDLELFYIISGFQRIKSYKDDSTYMMVWLPKNSNLLERFEKLFE